MRSCCDTGGTFTSQFVSSVGEKMEEVEERGYRIMKDRESRLLPAENSKIIFMLLEQSEQPSKVLKKKKFQNRYKVHFKQAPLKGKNLRRRGTQGEFG